MKLRRMNSSEKIFTIIINILLVILAIVAFYPLWYILISAFSDPVMFDQSISNQGFILLPKGFTSKYFLEHIKNLDIWRAYGNTLIYTVFGTILSMVLTIFAAYALSRKNIWGSKFLNIIVILTIWLRPGMIATYLNIEDLGLIGSRWGLLLPFAFSGFNVILLKISFQTIHKDLLEAAQIDGAGHFRMLWNVVLPNTIPALTTITLFYAIDRWNGYFWAEIVLLNDKLYPLQVIVKKMLQNGGDSTMLFEGMVSAYALIVIAVLPIILVFPFIQKYFKKGIMDGSVK